MRFLEIIKYIILSLSYKISLKNKSIFETVHFIELMYLAKRFPQTSYAKQNKKSQDRKQKIAIKSDEKSLKRFGLAVQTSLESRSHSKSFELFPIFARQFDTRRHRESRLAAADVSTIDGK